MVRVLPAPAPAMTNLGPSPQVTAARCASFSSCSRSRCSIAPAVVRRVNVRVIPPPAGSGTPAADSRRLVAPDANPWYPVVSRPALLQLQSSGLDPKVVGPHHLCWATEGGPPGRKALAQVMGSSQKFIH